MAENTKKDSTNELPMFDLEEAIGITVDIHEKALETASMAEVAKGCGYANPTSTPFYRRIAAARLFSLLKAPKPELTSLALDFLKPDTEESKHSSLTRAIMGVKTYSEFVNQHLGKRLNPELIANKLEKDPSLSLSKVCAKTCASVFVASLRFAGFIADDETVRLPAGSIESEKPKEPAESDRLHPKKDTNGELEADEESQVQTLYLDNKRKRKITIKAPFTVTKEELERIRAWLGFQLIIEEPAAPNRIE